MSLAQTMYANDFQWYAPAKVTSTNNGTATGDYPFLTNYWYHLLRPYLGKPQKPSTTAESKAMMQEGVLWCPSQVKRGTGVETRAYSVVSFHRLVRDAPNTGNGRDLHPGKIAEYDPATGLNPAANSSPACFVKPESIDASVHTSKIFFISSQGVNANQVNGNGYVHYALRTTKGWTGTGTGTSDPVPNFVHTGAKNVLFLDLHVESLKDDVNININDLVLD
jgi:prepilin-type processing-associated H-X9-DG protein